VSSATLALIDYGSGNLRSAERALARAAAESGQRIEITVTSDPQTVSRAERIVLPGVGAFADCMAGLAAVSGLIEAMTESVRQRGQPFLGICVGMQLLAGRGHEHGTHAGLGWIEGEVVRLAPHDPTLKIPQMGWNELDLLQGGHPLLEGLVAGDHAYFVHSYHFRPRTPGAVLAEVTYGETVAAMVTEENIAGTQFHPEKSQRVGLRILSNFLTWKP
jgi:imidazole glycerol-phosphate synthase subunit HisH